MGNDVSINLPVVLVQVHAFPLIHARHLRRALGPKPDSSTLQPRNTPAASIIGLVTDMDLRSHTALGLFANAADSDSNVEDNVPPSWDLELARTHLERLMSEPHGVNCNDDNNKKESSTVFSEATFSSAEKLESRLTNRLLIGIGEDLHSHRLTSMDRVRRTTEINLLSQLETDLRAAGDLHHFWVHERGSNAARALQNADDVFQQGESSWNQAERMFTQLIQEYDPHWVEPLHRLGMLYYLQGRHAEARVLEEAVLRRKPWHVGALSNYVRIAESQHDVDTALLWAARRLPPRIGRRRSEWVHRSVQAAMDSLCQMEKELGMFLGEASLHAVGEEAWQ
jgi:hypothetical protein